MRRTLFFLTLFLLVSSVCRAEERDVTGKKERASLTDIVTKPVELILAPVLGEDLAKSVTAPAKSLHIPFAGMDIAKDGDVGPLIVTTAPKKQRAVDLPGFVSVITRQDIENSSARHVYDLLRKEPGVYVRDYTGVGKAVSVDMRGFGETAHQNVLVLVDGRRINEIDLSGTDWAQIPIENVERVEIIRGSGSVVYGDNATSGVINVITRRGKKGFHLYGGAEFGSYKHRGFTAGGYGGTDKIAYNGFYKHTSTSGYRLNSDLTSDTLQGVLSFYPSDAFTLEVSGGWHRDWYGMPGALTREEIDRLGRRGSTRPNDGAKTETAYIQADNAVFFDNDWLFEKECALFTSFWGRRRNVDANFVSFNFESMSDIRSWGLSQKLTVDSEGDNFKLSNTFGYDIFIASNSIKSYSLELERCDIRKDTFGIFWDQRFDLGRSIVSNFGMRGEWARYIFDEPLENTYEQKKPSASAIEAGIAYKYLPAGAIYGRFSRSFRFPAVDEFYGMGGWGGLNPELRTQRADTWEVGIRDENWKYLMPSVNFFRMTVKDEIYYDPFFFVNANYEETRRYGIETSFVSKPFGWLDGYVSYTWLDAKFSTGTLNGNRVPMVPEHKLAFGLNWKAFEVNGVSLVFNYNAEIIGSQFTISDMGNTHPKNKSYFVNDLKATLESNGFHFFFGCNNLLNERYAEYARTDNYYPAPGRNFYGGVKFRI